MFDEERIAHVLHLQININVLDKRLYDDDDDVLFFSLTIDSMKNFLHRSSQSIDSLGFRVDQ